MEGLETLNRAEISQPCGSWSKVFFKLKKIRFYRVDSRQFAVPKWIGREKLPIWARLRSVTKLVSHCRLRYNRGALRAILVPLPIVVGV